MTDYHIYMRGLIEIRNDKSEGEEKFAYIKVSVSFEQLICEPSLKFSVVIWVLFKGF